jgi:hypothetical protein
VLHVLGGGVRVGPAEARHVARDDPLALGRVVQPVTVVGERVEPELPDRIERRRGPRVASTTFTT